MIIDYTIDWDQGTGTYVQLQTGVTTTSFTKTALSAGTTYKFKVSARNSIGTGATSTEFTIVAATIPSTLAAPTTSYDGATDTVTIDWTTPTDEGGLTITGYVLQIQHADNTWSQETANCDGVNNATVKSNTACTIPASVLRASPFYLASSASVTAKVVASNSLGSSTESSTGNGATMPSVSD